MKEDALDLIATYTAIANAFAAVVGIAVVIVYGSAAWVVIEIGRRAFDRIGASFTRAQHTIADIQQPRKETP